jgi:capsular exopolysaccharide synthesis family protein
MNSSVSNQNFQPPPPPEEVHLSDYVNVLLRRRKTFIITFLAVFVGVLLFTFLMKPVYEATATLHVKDEQAKGGVLGELSLLASSNPVDAEIEIVQSRTNAENVVKRLHLDWQVAKKSDGLGFRLLEFTSTAEQPSYVVELTGTNTYRVRDDDDSVVGSGTSGVLLRGKGISLLVGELRGKAGDSFRLELLPFNETVDSLRKKVKVKELGKKTNIIEIDYANTDPVRARDVVNTLVQAYLEQAIGFKSEEASRTVGFVENQLQGVRNELDTAEKNLQTFKTASGVVDLDAEAQSLIQTLSETEKQRADISLQKKQVEFALSSLKDAQRRGVMYTPAVMRDDPSISGLAARLADLEVQRRSLLADYTKEHPVVKANQAQIDELQQRIQATYETALRNQAKQEASVGQQLARYEGQLKGLPEVERDLARLTRFSKVNADIYTFLLQKHEEARIAEASTISHINIVDPAIVPNKPVKPQKKKNLILGLLVGCMLGVGLAFFQDYLDDTIKNADDVKRFLGLPVLGQIPHIPHEHTGDEGLAETLITHHDPKAATSEAFRSVRSALHFSGVGRKRQCLLITSTFPGEGKTTLSANLAIIQAQTGARVILLGCDLRRPSFHNLFKSERSPGLSELLAGDAQLDDVIRQASDTGIDFINAGTLPPNPSELLGSERMGEVIGALRQRYDFIILDAPPTLAVTDALVLTPFADMIVVVLEAGRVPRKAGDHLVEVLRNVPAPVAGVVVNDASGKSQLYYGFYGYRYGAYGYYGEEEKAATEKKGLWKKFFPYGKK